MTYTIEIFAVIFLENVLVFVILIRLIPYLGEVKKTTIKYLDFEVDKLTRSIENVKTGDSFATAVSLLLKDDLKYVNKKNGWKFNWKDEWRLNDREVYKLIIESSPEIIQAVVSLRIEENFVYMPLIECAPFNRGKDKVYLGAPGNLIAFACRLSFQRGFSGFVSFHAKTALIDHYTKSLGAVHHGGQLMVIDSMAAGMLVEKYFKS